MPLSSLAQSRWLIRRHAVIVTLALGGCLLSLAGGLLMARWIEQKAEVEFRQGAEQVARDLARGLSQPSFVLEGARAVHAVSGGMDAARLQAYWTARDGSRSLPGLRALGWVQRWPAAEIASREAAIRRGGVSTFELRGAGDGVRNADADAFALVRGQWQFGSRV